MQATTTAGAQGSHSCRNQTKSKPLEPPVGQSWGGETKNDDDLSLGDMSTHSTKSDDFSSFDDAVADLKNHMEQGKALLSKGGQEDEDMKNASNKRSHSEAATDSVIGHRMQFGPFVHPGRKRIFDQFPDDAKVYFLGISDSRKREEKYFVYVRHLISFLSEKQQARVAKEAETNEEAGFSLLRRLLEKTSLNAHGDDTLVQNALRQSLHLTMNNV